MVAGKYASVMRVKVSYPHDPERLDRWIGKHASVIQASLAVGWTVVALVSVGLAILVPGRKPLLFLFVPVVLGLFVGFFGWWSYQEGGGGDKDDGGNEG